MMTMISMVPQEAVVPQEAAIQRAQALQLLLYRPAPFRGKVALVVVLAALLDLRPSALLRHPDGQVLGRLSTKSLMPQRV